ncbi:MAG: tRNA 4-thiouridine(8) synthase ThiI [Clostridia bacterium]|nr:tRNA 4-thiouridine(8) synthase ThiI [Clostridia bacterium]
MRQLILVRYGEIYLKGLNRPYFIRTLVNRIKQAVRPFGGKVWLNDSRIFVSDMTDMEACMEKVRKVFGVHSLCPAIEMDKSDFNAVCEQAAEMMKDIRGTFKVDSRRSDKRYPMTSPEINMQLGGYVLSRCPDLKVDIHKPEYVMNVEIRDHAYLYVRVIEAVGGMPVGTGGKATLLLSGGIDSPVAGYCIAKRGVEISAVHFHSYPYTSERAKEKVLTLAKQLSEYCCGIKVYVVPFTEPQLQIHEKCPEEYGTLIMRRFMMRIAARIARNEGSKALITGESLGQVASQTIEALCCTDAVADMPVFRPLIGNDKIEIIRIAEKIGTYETSCEPYEDCCTVFTPRHPATHPKMDHVERAEACLDIEALVNAAVEGTEVIEL